MTAQSQAQPPTGGWAAIEKLGGVKGLIYSALPVIVFVPLSSTFGMLAAIVGALCVATATLIWRLIRRESTRPAILGFVGVGVSALAAYLTGETKGYFLIGIWMSMFWAAVFGISVMIRRPLCGYIWSWFSGRGTGWRHVQGAVRAFDLATAMWALVFAARYVVQDQLYDADEAGWLGFARIIMGWPLAAVGALLTVVAVRVAANAMSATATAPDPPTDVGQPEGPRTETPG